MSHEPDPASPFCFLSRLMLKLMLEAGLVSSSEMVAPWRRGQ